MHMLQSKSASVHREMTDRTIFYEQVDTLSLTILTALSLVLLQTAAHEVESVGVDVFPTRAAVLTRATVRLTRFC